MGNFFTGIYIFFEKRKIVFFVSASIVFFFLLYFSSKIKFHENITDMLPQDVKTEAFSQFVQSSGFSDKIMLSVSISDTAFENNIHSLINFSDEIVQFLKNDNRIKSIEYTVNENDASVMMNIIEEHLPIFFDEADILDSIVTNENIEKKISENFNFLSGPAGFTMKNFIQNDPLGLNFLAYKKLNNFQIDEKFEVCNSHFFTHDKNHLLIFITPSFQQTSDAISFFENLDSVVSSQQNFQISYFGAPAVAAGNSKQIRRDSLFTISIAALLIVVMIILFFRKISAPIVVLIPAFFGAFFSLSIIYLIKGEISVIAVAGGSLVLGIAVNYSLHFLTHIQHHSDVRSAINELSFPMTIGSATTVGGFLCLLFVNAPVLKDLGLFAALSLIGAALSSLIFLPHFIKIPENYTAFNFKPTFSKSYFAWLFILLTPVLFYFATRVEFEGDMNKLNYMTHELKNSEQFFNSITSFYQKSVFVVTKGKTQEDALIENEKIIPELNRMKESGIIASYSSVSSILLSEQEQKNRIERWENFWTNEKRKKVTEKLISEGNKFGFNESAFFSFKQLVSKKFQPLTDNDKHKLKNFFLTNHIEEKNGETVIISFLKTTPENTGEIYSSLKKFQNTAVFDRQFITNTLVTIVNEDFNFIALCTSILVFTTLLIIYGRIELALITFIPMVISWIWILGIMGILGIKFNIINIILSTLVFALGDDYCIFTTDGLLHEYARSKKNTETVRISVFLSAVTTIIGLGVLIFSKHPAMSSIAVVSIIGIVCVLISSQAIQPMLFNFLIKNPAEKKITPYTFWGMLKSVFAFTYFAAGAILLSAIGVILLKIIPLKKSTGKYFYHFILSKFTGSLIYIMGNVKKKIINGVNENFSSPAVVIANHQSFLDILLLTMLHPKLILLTNKWVWNSPVFGFAIRMAEYYPVLDGIENSVNKLSEKVKDGYSIVVFPEGTRSIDDTVKRLHKGAFFLAEKLNLDILPILIHGSGYAMPKGNFYLKDGQLTLKFLQRIKPDDKSCGITYSERAKKIGKYFRNEYEILKNKIETTAYFKPHLISNDIYKSPVLEWYMRIKLKLENNYETFDEILPLNGKILDAGCGYGFMSYMLGLVSPERNIFGIDYDENKIEIAKNCFLKNKNISFETADILQYNFTNYDGIILSDVLHYLQPDEQIFLLEKCIENLTPSGKLVIRDGLEELKNRHAGTKLSELFSTKILKFNKTQKAGLSFISSKMIYSMAEKYSLKISKIDNAKFTSNVIFILNK